MSVQTNTPTGNKIDINVKAIIHSVIMLIFMFGFRFLPAPGTVTPFGMAVAGVFFGLIYGWSFLGILWPSLMGIFGLALTGYGSVEKVVIDMFSNSTILMMMVGSLVFMALMQSKVADWLMAKIVGSNLAKKSPMATVMIIFFATVCINSFGGNMIFYFAIFPILVNTVLKCGYARGDKFNVFFLTGFMACIQLGLCFRPFIGWGLMTVGTMMQLTQTGISYGAYMIVMVILDALFVVSYPFLMKICGCDFSKLANVDIAQAFGVNKDEKLNLVQKIVLTAFLAFLVIVILFSTVGAKLGALYTFYGQISVLGMMIIFWIAMTVIKVDGKPMLNIAEASKMFTWDMLFLVAIALLISSVLTSTDTGISGWLAKLIAPLFAGSGQIGFLIALCVLTLFLTNVANNIAVCFIMMNIVASMYLNGFQVNLLAASMIISINAVIAFLTPASSMPGAMLHACDANTPASMYKYCPIILVYFVVLMLIVMVPTALLF